MSSSPSENSKLTSEELANLVKDNLVYQTTTGKRKVSTAFLSPPTTNTRAASGSYSGLSVRHVSGSQPPPGGFIDLPSTLDSAETLKVCGFNTFTANHILSNFLNKSVDSPYTLVDYATAHVVTLNAFGTQTTNTSMTQLLTNIGFSDEMKQIFANPQHVDIIKTQTLHHWVVDTIRGNYYAVEILQSRVKDAAQNSTESKKRGKKPKLDAPLTLPKATMSGHSRSSPFPVPHVMVSSAPPVKPGYVCLLKGKSPAGMCHGYGEPVLNFIDENGNVNLSTISSNTGGDWNGFRRKYYFTPDSGIAEKYRLWAAERVKYLESWTIHAQVPEDYIDTLKREDLWWGFDFRWFTWLSRRQEPITPEMPIIKYDRAQLLVGHIAKSPYIAGMRQNQVQTAFNEEDLLYNADGAKATQWVFDSDCTIPLGQRLGGNIHIDVFDPLVQLEYPTGSPTSSKS